MSGYRRIATEEAFCTPSIFAETEKLIARGDVEPGFAKIAASILGDSPGAQEVKRRLLDLDAGRLANMDADGVDFALISINSPAVQIFDADLAVGLAAEANDILAEAVQRHPSRLAGLAAVAPQDPGKAARELERAKSLGLKGLLINSSTKGEYLDLPKFSPIFEAAEALDMPLYLHPREPGPTMVAPYLDYGLYFAGWGFAAECGLSAMRLIMSGLFDRYPRMRIALGHMGEGIPFWLQRIDNRYELQVKLGAVTPLEKLPSVYFLENFHITTSGVMTDPALRLAIDVLGIERVQFAGDYPFEDAGAGVKFIETAKISDDERKAIFEDNAVNFWGLPS
jgi:5-carboxyvanillate decarboxylase